MRQRGGTEVDQRLCFRSSVGGGLEARLDRRGWWTVGSCNRGLSWYPGMAFWRCVLRPCVTAKVGSNLGGSLPPGTTLRRALVGALKPTLEQLGSSCLIPEGPALPSPQPPLQVPMGIAPSWAPKEPDMPCSTNFSEWNSGCQSVLWGVFLSQRQCCRATSGARRHRHPLPLICSFKWSAKQQGLYLGNVHCA